MKTKIHISILFFIAALYDGILGLAFLVVAGDIFRQFNVTPPNHFGYIHFPATILLIFAWMFAVIARDPEKNRNLIPYGMGLKVAYCWVVFYYWFINGSGIPNIWKPFAVADLIFLVLFVLAFISLGQKEQST